ncbi:putative bromodomain adjacent to zinc finger domain protein 1A [Paratrimastix pyriformis]|uniref:Bromodomain adjacent to zinc finger domain protein 1A n=1 Tax=Paratrimastix pyriformis TaxID=342808 RepID=A0ABQ8UU62_9EUKA|nr:putative bromodomain adjacent to zinc finger domain protein 1A [Paratrimastix pyriformis]
MPQQRGKAIHVPKVADLGHFSDDQEVWFIEMTGEVFTSYEKYLDAIDLYQSSVWSCRHTGRSGLTYQEALDSEQESLEKIESLRLTPLEYEHICRTTHHSILQIEDLVHRLQADFTARLFVGQSVLVTHPSATGSRKGQVVAVHGAALTIKDDDDGDDARSEGDEKPAPRVRTPTGAKKGKAPAAPAKPTKKAKTALPNLTYDVVMLGDGGEEGLRISNIAREALKPARVIPLTVMRMLVRDIATREFYLGAPFVVRPDLVARFHLATALPQHRRPEGRPREEQDQGKEKEGAEKKAHKAHAKEPEAKKDAKRDAKKDASKKAAPGKASKSETRVGPSDLRPSDPPLALWAARLGPLHPDASFLTARVHSGTRPCGRRPAPTKPKLPPAVHYPMDDTQVPRTPAEQQARPPAPEGRFAVPPEAVADVLMLWDALSTFRDQFGVDLLAQGSWRRPWPPEPSPLLAEIHHALLQLLFHDEGCADMPTKTRKALGLAHWITPLAHYLRTRTDDFPEMKPIARVLLGRPATEESESDSDDKEAKDEKDEKEAGEGQSEEDDPKPPKPASRAASAGPGSPRSPAAAAAAAAALKSPTRTAAAHAAATAPAAAPGSPRPAPVPTPTPAAEPRVPNARPPARTPAPTPVDPSPEPQPEPGAPPAPGPEETPVDPPPRPEPTVPAQSKDAEEKEGDEDGAAAAGPRRSRRGRGRRRQTRRMTRLVENAIAESVADALPGSPSGRRSTRGRKGTRRPRRQAEEEDEEKDEKNSSGAEEKEEGSPAASSASGDEDNKDKEDEEEPEEEEEESEDAAEQSSSASEGGLRRERPSRRSTRAGRGRRAAAKDEEDDAGGDEVAFYRRRQTRSMDRRPAATTRGATRSRSRAPAGGAGGAAGRAARAARRDRQRQVLVGGPGSSEDEQEEQSEEEAAPKGRARKQRAAGGKRRAPKKAEGAEEEEETKAEEAGAASGGEADRNDDFCYVCRRGGELLCCDGPCGHSFHTRCLHLGELPPGEDAWYCPECTRKMARRRPLPTTPPAASVSPGTRHGAHSAEAPAALSGYRQLTVGERVAVLRLLLDDVLETKALREYIDSAHEKADQFRAEQRQAETALRKRLAELKGQRAKDTAELEQCAADLKALVRPSPPPHPLVPHHHIPLALSAPLPHSLTPGSPAPAPAASQEAQAAKSDGLSTRTSSAKQRELGGRVEALQRDIRLADEEAAQGAERLKEMGLRWNPKTERKVAGFSIRTVPLGEDRFRSKYYLFWGNPARLYVEYRLPGPWPRDAVPSTAATTPTPLPSTPTTPGAAAAAATTTTTTTSATPPPAPTPAAPLVPAGATGVLSPTAWGFYDTPAALEALVGWLDERGIRERQLKKALKDRMAFLQQEMLDAQRAQLNPPTVAEGPLTRRRTLRSTLLRRASTRRTRSTADLEREQEQAAPPSAPIPQLVAQEAPKASVAPPPEAATQPAAPAAAEPPASVEQVPVIRV